MTEGDEAGASISGQAPNQTLNLTLPRALPPDMSDYVKSERVVSETSTYFEDIYNVTYINEMLGDVENLLEILDIGTGAQEG